MEKMSFDRDTFITIDTKMMNCRTIINFNLHRYGSRQSIAVHRERKCCLFEIVDEAKEREREKIKLSDPHQHVINRHCCHVTFIKINYMSWIRLISYHSHTCDHILLLLSAHL